MPCSAMQCRVRCNAVCNAMPCAMQCRVQCNAMCNAMSCAMQRNATQRNAMQCSTDTARAAQHNLTQNRPEQNRIGRPPSVPLPSPREPRPRRRRRYSWSLVRPSRGVAVSSRLRRPRPPCCVCVCLTCAVVTSRSAASPRAISSALMSERMRIRPTTTSARARPAGWPAGRPPWRGVVWCGVAV